VHGPQLQRSWSSRTLNDLTGRLESIFEGLTGQIERRTRHAGRGDT
jgi:hypothetical protein